MIASEIARRPRHDEHGTPVPGQAARAETHREGDELKRAFRRTCEAVEAEIIATTRRIDSFTMSARDDLDTLVEVLDYLADTLAAPTGANSPPAKPTGELDSRLKAARTLARTIAETLGSASGALALLPRRTVSLLQESHSIDRRRHARVAIARRGRLVMGGTAVPCITMDISEGGALVRLLGPRPEDRTGAGLVVLDLECLGRAQAIVIAGTDDRLNLAFCSTPQQIAQSLAEQLAEARRRERRLVATARRAADDIAGEMERLGPDEDEGDGRESPAASDRSTRIPSTLRTILGVAASQHTDIEGAEAIDGDGRVLARWRADAVSRVATDEHIPLDELPPVHGEHGRHRCRIREIAADAAGTREFAAQLDVEVRARAKHWGFVRLILGV